VADDPQRPAARLLDQRHQPREGRLAAAGLADDAERLADLEVNETPSTARSVADPAKNAAADLVAPREIDGLGDRRRRLGRAGYGGKDSQETRLRFVGGGAISASRLGSPSGSGSVPWPRRHGRNIGSAARQRAVRRRSAD